MGLLKEVWIRDIQENLYYENEFINLAVDHSEYLTSSVVHIPQAGTVPNVVKNRTELVADLQTATDTEITYSTDNYTTDPFLVKDIEDLQITYDKRMSVMQRHLDQLGDAVATNTLQTWAVDGGVHVLRSSGAETDLEESMPHDTATGKRLALTKRDFARVAARFDKQKVSRRNRYAIVPSSMYYNLFTDAELVANIARLGEDAIKTGVVGEIHGFKIIPRGEVVRYTNAASNALREATAAPAATDCDGAIFFSRYVLTQALGGIKVRYDEDNPRSYGNIMSAELNQGASVLRENHGVVCVAQGYVAP